MKAKLSSKSLIFLSVLVSFLLFFPLVQSMGIGLSPPQLRAENTPMGNKTNVATLIVTSTEKTQSVYLIFKISCLERTRQQKLRVICTACKRYVGIQRGDIIYPAKIINLTMNGTKGSVTVEYKDGTKQNVSKQNVTGKSYAVGDYVLIGENETGVVFVMKKINITEALLNNGYCPFCGASEDKMIFYDLPPDDVLSNVSLSSKDYPLEPYKNGFYRTIDKVPPQAAVTLDIAMNIPDKKEYHGQHWEIRIMATSANNLNESQGMSMVYGPETKFLVDTPPLPQIQSSSNIGIQMPWFYIELIGGVAGIIGVILFVFILNKRRKPMKIEDIFGDTKTRGKIL